MQGDLAPRQRSGVRARSNHHTVIAPRLLEPLAELATGRQQERAAAGRRVAQLQFQQPRRGRPLAQRCQQRPQGRADDRVGQPARRIMSARSPALLARPQIQRPRRQHLHGSRGSPFADHSQHVLGPVGARERLLQRCVEREAGRRTPAPALAGRMGQDLAQIDDGGPWTAHQPRAVRAQQAVVHQRFVDPAERFEVERAVPPARILHSQQRPQGSPYGIVIRTRGRE
ncbi:hypothetical protein [Nannocystis pusilla]|uniref:hypothetical protein n=1 Tax=Nannocystis pusilla TaxID=889268 RepID=UPI003B7C72EB